MATAGSDDQHRSARGSERRLLERSPRRSLCRVGSERPQRPQRPAATHRDGARLLAVTPPAGPRRLRHIERVLRALRLSGLDDHDVAGIAALLNNFVTEFAADEARFDEAAAAMGVTRRKMFAAVRKQFQALPRDEFPSLVALAGALTDDEPDAVFQLGIDVLLRGIEGRARASRVR
jgi:TetR/AcrR family transcriptional regulator, tetracycline repressor protein